MDAESNLVIPTPFKEEIKPKILYMEKLIKASSVINMWPKSKKTSPFVYHFKVWFVFTVCVALILSFGFQIRKDYKNLDSIAVLMDFVTVFVSGTFRYLYIYARGDKYLLLVSHIHNDFIHSSLFPTQNRSTIMKYYKGANKLILVYCTFTLFWILQICTVPIISYWWETLNLPSDFNGTAVPYPLPMKVFAPFDTETQPGNAVFYAFQLISCLTIGWIYVVVDSFWYMVILLTIGQFVLLKESVKTITEILKKESTTNELEPLKETEVKEVEGGLKHCIKQHQFTREFVRLVDDINNPNILVDSLHAVISIGFILLDVTIALNIGDWNKVMYSLEYFITSIVHMFFFDWLGNQITAKEEELAEAVYDIPWQRCPQLKPLVLLMAIQARRPSQLTGGRMYTLSLEFFTTMIRAIFSYFTFLLQLRNGRPQK